jgi:hypothetical protein
LHQRPAKKEGDDVADFVAAGDDAHHRSVASRLESPRRKLDDAAPPACLEKAVDDGESG